MARIRFPLGTLRVALDLPAEVTITAMAISGDLVDFELDGATVEPPPAGTSARLAWDDSGPPEEITAEYSVDGFGHRSFGRFKLPEGPPTVPLGEAEDEGEAEETLPPSGPGSRGGKTRSSKEG